MSRTPSPAPPKRPPKSLQLFQSQYSAHLRNPDVQPRPSDIPEERSQIYQGLLFNNICSLISPCFPVTRQILGQEQWLQLCRAFYDRWSCSTPYFNRIAYEMVQYVQEPNTELALPEWLAELMHYEWIELQVETHPEVVSESSGVLCESHRLQLNPTLANLNYRWPVHQIAPEHEPTAPAQTFLLVYRTSQHQVKFIEANPLTATLVTLIGERAGSAEQTLNDLSEMTPEIPYATILQFGMSLIEDLAQKEALIICGMVEGS